MNLRTRVGILAVAAIAALSAQAHPGHAAFSEGAKHFVTSPNHIGPVLLFAGVVAAAAQLLKSRAERNFVRAIAAVITLLAVLS